MVASIRTAGALAGYQSKRPGSQPGRKGRLMAAERIQASYMRFETIAILNCEGSAREIHIAITYRVDLVRPFPSRKPKQVVEVERTEWCRPATGHMVSTPHGDWSPAEWFWDICGYGIQGKLDAEMICEWNAEYGLAIPKVTP